MSPTPMGSADARQIFGISSAGVTTIISSMAYSIAGLSTSARNTTPVTSENASKNALRAGRARLTSADMRMCSDF